MDHMIRLVQFFEADGNRAVALVSERVDELRVIEGYARVYDLALAAIRARQSLATFVQAHLSRTSVEYERIISEQRLLPPLDHPNPAHCLVSLTGLTHMGSAQSRD